MSNLTLIPQFNKVGEKIEDVSVSFSLPEKINEDLLAQAIRIHLANQRQGNADTKTKGEVRGGGKKPWKQKGTGRARQGSTRSPHWRGGGVAHGPKPRDLSLTMSRRMGQVARVAALAQLLTNGQLAVIEESKVAKISTKQTALLLAKIAPSGRLSLVTTSADKDISLSARNLVGVEILNVANLSIFDILNSPFLVLTSTALPKLFSQ